MVGSATATTPNGKAQARPRREDRRDRPLGRRRHTTGARSPESRETGPAAAGARDGRPGRAGGGPPRDGARGLENLDSRPDGTRIRAVADPVIEGPLRGLGGDPVALAIACRAWAAYPSDHPNVTRAVDAARRASTRCCRLTARWPLASRAKHLRVGVWTSSRLARRARSPRLVYAAGRRPPDRPGASCRRSSGRRALARGSGDPPRARLYPATGPPRLPERPSPPSPALGLLGRSTDDDQASEATGQPGAVLAQRSPAQRGARVGRQATRADSDSDQPGDRRAAVPAELAMVGWLRTS